jgi:hypothetical protein
MHVALGRQYRGRNTVAGAVVYCAFEGGFGFSARIEAFRRHHLADALDATPKFFLQPLTLNLVKQHGALISAIKATVEDIPVLLVLDTLNRSIEGSESNDADMSAYVQAADAVRETFNCAIIIIHHCGVDGSRPRGHTSLTGACDAQLSVHRDGAHNVIVTVEAMKDGAEGATITSRLEPVDLGVDEVGEPITSCVVKPVEGAPDAARKPTKKLAPAAQIALRALQKAIHEMGEPAPASNHIPPNVRTVTIENWRKYAYASSISDGEDRARRQAFKRATETLVAGRHVGTWNETAWIV